MINIGRATNELLASLSILETLPTIEKKVEFTNLLIQDALEIPQSFLCITGCPIASTAPESCQTCIVRTGKDFDTQHACRYNDSPDYYCYEIATSLHYFGYLVMPYTQIKDELLPLILNFISALSIIFENTLQKEELLELNRILSEEIDKRKKKEEYLRKSEERYRTLHESITDGAFVIDKEWRYVMINDVSANELLKMNKKDLLGKKITNIFPGIEKTPFFKAYKNVMDNRIPDTIINNFTHPDGREGAYEVRIYPTPEGILCIARDITEQKENAAILKTALAEKELLLKELYHRTKNNMQVIRAMLMLKASHTQNQEVKDTFKDIEHKIMTMALVHQKLYQTQNLSHINLEEYISELLPLLIKSYKTRSQNIEIETKLSPVNISIETAIPCGLIINELITNILKYAFPDKRNGLISIELRSDAETIKLYIRDNGIGLPQNFDYRKSPSLGLQATIALAEHQLRGKIECQQNKGTEFIITFAQKTSSGTQ